MDNLDVYSDDEALIYDDDASMATVESDGCDESTVMKSNDYKVLTEPEIQKSLDDDVAALASALSESNTVAIILLLNYKWHVVHAQEAWFNDEDGVRARVGLLKKPAVECRSDDGGELLVCGICSNAYAFDLLFGTSFGICGHRFCVNCMRKYVSNAINEDGKCLFLRCPEPSCNAAIGYDVVDLLVCDEDKRRYKGFLIRSYVETNKKIKWCPSPGCECAIECEVGSESFGVTCNCLGTFCWNCVEDFHRPVECEVVGKWMLQHYAEIDNTTKILAASKRCPKCKVSIEKSSGSMHMTCEQVLCGYEFCWVCLGAWNIHDSVACNGYKESLKKEEDELVAKAKKEYRNYMKYVHYYKRWDANHQSREKAIADLRELKATKLGQLQRKLNIKAAELEFITYAWEQIVEGRRVLKWTYVYKYLMSGEESVKKKLFEYLQGEAEVALERLHDYAEAKLNSYLEDDADLNDFFTEFYGRLTTLAKTTGTYFANFLKGVENGLVEADDTPLASDDEFNVWRCQRCTYLNNIEHNKCYMCLHMREDDAV